MPKFKGLRGSTGHLTIHPLSYPFLLKKPENTPNNLLWVIMWRTLPSRNQAIIPKLPTVNPGPRQWFYQLQQNKLPRRRAKSSETLPEYRKTWVFRIQQVLTLFQSSFEGKGNQRMEFSHGVPPTLLPDRAQRRDRLKPHPGRTPFVTFWERKSKTPRRWLTSSCTQRVPSTQHSWVRAPQSRPDETPRA